MDTLKAMEIFAGVMRSRSYAAAAQQLGVSRAVVTKYVMELEKHLGVRLLNRTTRHVSPTEVGEDYYAFCTRMLDEMRAKEAAISRRQAEASGVLRVMAPKSFGGLYMGKVMSDFTRRHTEVSVSLFLADLSLRSVDLVENGFDLAIRLTDPSDSSLVQRRLGTARWALCAAPAYLKAKGLPETPAGLKDHQCLLHSRSPSMPAEAVWSFRPATQSRGRGPKRPLQVKVSGGITTNSVMALRRAALEGAGIALLPTYCVGDDLADGRLKEILPGYTVPDEQISVIFPHRNLLPAKSRLFIDFLASEFRTPPWRDPGPAGPSGKAA